MSSSTPTTASPTPSASLPSPSAALVLCRGFSLAPISLPSPSVALSRVEALASPPSPSHLPPQPWSCVEALASPPSPDNPDSSRLILINLDSSRLIEIIPYKSLPSAHRPVGFRRTPIYITQLPATLRHHPAAGVRPRRLLLVAPYAERSEVCGGSRFTSSSVLNR